MLKPSCNGCSVLSVVLVFCSILPLAAQNTKPTNPNQIALLKWYAANRAARFTVGNIPGGLAFDGQSMWVTIFNNAIVKVRSSDGAVLGTFPLPGSPSDVAFDGENVWVTIPNSNVVTKLRASDGSHLGDSQQAISLGA